MSAYKRMLFAALALAYSSHDAMAMGTGTVSSGSATITNPNANTTLITQTSNKAVINWTGAGAFNTTAGQTVQFVQPSATSISLNLISGGPTSFFGSLLSNGKVWLINPEGMLFGSGAKVNVKSLLLSTAGISDPNGSGFFTNAGTTYNFDQPGNPTASITANNALLGAQGIPGVGGDIVIQAPQVTITNGANVNSLTGTVHILGGSTFTADFNGDGMINFAVIDTPVNTKVAGANSTIEVSNNSIVHGDSITIGAVINQDAVLDHVINLGGQYETGTYNQASNPQNVVIARAPTVYETIIPNNVTPSAVTTIPTDTLTNIDPLTRPVASLGDESVRDTTVDPSIANVTYERPYRVTLSASIDEGALTLLSPAAGAAAGTTQSASTLGALSPSAGGGEGDTTELGTLSPAAGGTNKATACGNNFLDSGWNGATSSNCPN